MGIVYSYFSVFKEDAAECEPLQDMKNMCGYDM